MTVCCSDAPQSRRGDERELVRDRYSESSVPGRKSRRPPPTVMNCSRVTSGLTSLLIAVSVSGCRYECRPSDAHCDDNVAFTCEVEVSDAHSRDNPYVWHERDCSAAPTERRDLQRARRSSGLRARAVSRSADAQPIAWEGATAALGADRIVLTIGDLVLGHRTAPSAASGTTGATGRRG